MRVCASATTEAMSRPRTFAVTTTRRLPFSRLIWFGPSVRLKRASWPSRALPVGWPAALGGSDTGRFFSASMSARADFVRDEPRSGNAGRLQDDPGFAPADGGTDYVLNGGKAETAACNFRLVGRDLQHRQARNLLGPNVGGAVNSRAEWRRSGWQLAAVVLELVAEDLYRDVAAHPRNEFVESHLDRLREFVSVAGQRLHERLLDLRDQRFSC